MKDVKKVSISSHPLVSSQKSSRLAAMRNKVEDKFVVKGNNQSQVGSGLKPELKVILNQAITIINEKLTTIIKSYPAGKKNTFFKLKFGISVEKVKEMSLKSVFDLLNLDSSKIRNFQQIEKMNCYGKIIQE